MVNRVLVTVRSGRRQRGKRGRVNARQKTPLEAIATLSATRDQVLVNPLSTPVSSPSNPAANQCCSDARKYMHARRASTWPPISTNHRTTVRADNFFHCSVVVYHLASDRRRGLTFADKKRIR